MSFRLVFGGAGMLGAILLWQRPGADATPHEAANGAFCDHAMALCDAVTGLVATLHQTAIVSGGSGRLPPPDVPGAIDASVTQANIDRTICRPGYSRGMRPAYAVTGPLKRRMMMGQHPGEPMADFELDHLIPISLGGAPLDARDLWLQPRWGQANAGDKNVLAYVLWRLVCEHRVPLVTAQAAISHDWTAAYQTYATPENVARYHFRHDGDRERDE